MVLSETTLRNFDLKYPFNHTISLNYDCWKEMNHARISIWKLNIKRCTYFYRPQGKAMFLEACVSHSVHRGRGSPLWTETPRQRHPNRDTPGQRHPWTETPLDRDTHGQRHPWTETALDRDAPNRDPQTETPRQRPSAATAAVVPILECILVLWYFYCVSNLNSSKIQN